MDNFNFSDISIGAGIVIVVVLFMLTGIARGLARTFFGLIALAAAGVACYWGFQRGDAIAGYVISNPDPWMSGAIGILMGLAVFFVARAVFGLIVKPIKIVDGKKRNNGGLGGILGILGGIAFCWFAISGVRYLANLAELQWINANLAEEGKILKLDPPALLKVRDTIDGSVPGKFHRNLDFINQRARVEMAKLKILTNNSYAMNVAAKNAAVMKAFGQADIREVLKTTPELDTYVQDNKFSHLLESKKLRELCKLPAACETLVEADVTKALGLAPKPKPKKKGNDKNKKKPNATTKP